MEPMAIELLAAERLKLQGYFTAVRVPFKREKGHGDLDVLGARFSDRQVVVIECKAWGSPEHYPTYRQKHAEWIRSCIDKLADDYKQYFLPNRNTNTFGLKKNDPAQFWYILPGALDPELQQTITMWPNNYRIIPIHQLLKDLFILVGEDIGKRRKRYPESALEMIRWILRSNKHGYFDLGELQVQLNKSTNEKQLYTPYVLNYVRSAAQAIFASSRNQHTRSKAIVGLLTLAPEGDHEFTIPQIRVRLESMGIKCTYQQVWVGLGTWERVGIVVSRKVGKGYSFKVPYPFAVAFAKLKLGELSPSSWLQTAD